MLHQCFFGIPLMFNILNMSVLSTEYIKILIRCLSHMITKNKLKLTHVVYDYGIRYANYIDFLMLKFLEHTSLLCVNSYDHFEVVTASGCKDSPSTVPTIMLGVYIVIMNGSQFVNIGISKIR